MHPAVTMAVLMAQKGYSSFAPELTPEQFGQVLESVCIGENWNEPLVDHRTVVLMITATLLFGQWVEQTVFPICNQAALEAVKVQARAHGVITTQMVASLGELADHLAAGRSGS
ncbi:hypothetical protein MOR12E_24210 [Methylobacterium oryzae]